MDLLISYSWSHFSQARNEAVRLLKRFRDPNPSVEKMGFPGIAVARSVLDNRTVVKKCHELFLSEPAFEFTLKWVPVDDWCETDLDAMKRLIAHDVRMAQVDCSLDVTGKIIDDFLWRSRREMDCIMTQSASSHIALVSGRRRKDLSGPRSRSRH